jgi:F-type H+-transporting ATPase subunit a
MLSGLNTMISPELTHALMAVSIKAEPLPFLKIITNSIFVCAIVAGLIIWFIRGSLKNRQVVPRGRQNLVEAFFEFLYTQVENVVGKKVAPRAFPVLATIFIITLTSNYFGLLPGVGTIGWGPKEQGAAFIDMETLHGSHGGGHEEKGHADKGHDAAHAPAAAPAPAADAHAKADDHHGEHHDLTHFTPLFRPATADVNFTLAMALVFMVFWWLVIMKEVGLKGFLHHTFGSKANLKGFLGLFVAAVFFVVGLIEVVGFLARPMSLSLRLFGNIFAGETLLHSMMTLPEMLGVKSSILKTILEVLIPLPFYFMELLVGVLQATVFTLLGAVYIQLATSGHDEHHDEHGHEEGHGDNHAPSPAH